MTRTVQVEQRGMWRCLNPWRERQQYRRVTQGETETERCKERETETGKVEKETKRQRENRKREEEELAGWGRQDLLQIVSPTPSHLALTPALLRGVWCGPQT